MEQRHGDRPRRDLDDLLLNGSWKPTKAQASSSVPTVPAVPKAREVSKSPTPQRRPIKNLPPRPIVEDEADALAKEFLRADIRASFLATYEPPFRGTIDQHPIILESDVSAADAAKLHKKLHAECQAEDSGERRFVLIPRADTHSPIRDDEEGPRRAFTEPPISKPTPSDAGRSTSRHLENPTPQLERRKSRQDLPTLQTEMPPFKRSTSAYATTPTTKQTARSPRASTGDFLLSPDAASFRGQSKGYFDIPATATSRQSQSGTSPLAEKRRSGGYSNSRPTTPVTEKRSSTGPDPYTRPKQEIGDKSTRPQLTTENGTRRSERAPSANAQLDPSEYVRHRKSSSQSSRRHYSDSDDDQDSTDSDRRRRRHHNHQRHHTEATLYPEDDRDYHNRSASKTSRSPGGKPGSRLTSPLASPNISPNQLPPVDRVESVRSANLTTGRDARRLSSRPVSPLTNVTEPPRAGNTLDPLSNQGRPRANSRSRSRRSSPVREASSATLPIPIPARIDLHSPGDTRRSPNIPQYENEHKSTSARPSTSQKPFWQPPPLQTPTDPNYLERPVGSYRRYSQDIDEGNIAPLPPCPRTTLTRGQNDWLTLPRAPVNSFNICPSCFQSTMAPTEFHSHFVPAPRKHSNEEVLCDFGSQPWYRIAWLLTRKERRKDLKLMSSLADISANVPPCLGKNEAVRYWYSVIDPETGHPVRNFDVCYACVKSIETLLPALKETLVRTDHKGPPGLPRVCDMRFDSKRFIHYFDALETAADSAADSSYAPDISDFANLAKRYAIIPECSGDQPLPNAHWYMITQLPEFTVCPECFDEVILPELTKKKAIPTMFNKSMQRLPSASCQLYSPRMRSIFEKAVSGNDYKMLATKARERRKRELECKEDMAEAKKMGKSGEKEMRLIQKEWSKWE